MKSSKLNLSSLMMKIAGAVCARVKSRPLREDAIYYLYPIYDVYTYINKYGILYGICYECMYEFYGNP